ncbi:MAG: hypothetical protein IH942_07465, partial [Acidobacteria bacterium]|nr:hypothetical protein [Acidobacteriota bacterium]
MTGAGLGIAVLVGILSVVVTLGVLEAGFRWFRWHRLTYVPLGEFAEALSERHPVYHHRYTPNATVTDNQYDYTVVYTTNDLGLRGTRSYGPKP